MRHVLSLSVVMTAVLAVVEARAEHAKITLEVEAGSRKETAFVDQTPPPSGKTPRPVFKVKAGEKLRIQWVLTNVYPNKTLENVVVHFYVARQGKVGQKELPELGADDVVLETAFDMDFKPGAKAGARNSVTIDTPGVYLIRIETRQTQSDHEHFSAIDLVVDPK